MSEQLRRIVQLCRVDVLFCSKCHPRKNATYRQVMKTVRGLRVQQYLCDEHAAQIAEKWGIELESRPVEKPGVPR